MKKKENFLEFLKISWFGVRICNFESKFSLQFFIFLSFFFHSPLFLMVFHCFSLFFMAIPGFQVPRARKMKKNEKKWKKWKKHEKKMKISSSFWRFPGSEWESATLSPNFHFFFICNFIFFHFPLFLMVFHCFSWLSWISGATGKENEKKKD